MPTNFLLLPRELRDRVYHALWAHTPGINVHGDKLKGHIAAWQDSYAQRNNALSDLAPTPLWLLTCKQILKEAVQEFAFGGIWNFDVDAIPPLQGIQSPLSPAEARRLLCNFEVCFGQRAPSMSGVPSTNYAPFPEEIAHFSQLLQYVGKSGSAQELTIRLVICPDLDDVQGMDLSELGAAFTNTHLTKISVTIHQCCSRKVRESLRESCAGEVKKLGALAMGTVTALVLEDNGDDIEFTINHHRSLK